MIQPDEFFHHLAWHGMALYIRSCSFPRSRVWRVRPDPFTLYGIYYRFFPSEGRQAGTRQHRVNVIRETP